MTAILRSLIFSCLQFSVHGRACHLLAPREDPPIFLAGTQFSLCAGHRRHSWLPVFWKLRGCLVRLFSLCLLFSTCVQRGSRLHTQLCLASLRTHLLQLSRAGRSSCLTCRVDKVTWEAHVLWASSQWPCLLGFRSSWCLWFSSSSRTLLHQLAWFFFLSSFPAIPFAPTVIAVKCTLTAFIRWDDSRWAPVGPRNFRTFS